MRVLRGAPLSGGVGGGAPDEAPTTDLPTFTFVFGEEAFAHADGVWCYFD